MAFDPMTALTVIQSHLKAQGRYSEVTIGEPKRPPPGSLIAGVFMSEIRTPMLTLSAPIRVYDVIVRHYMQMLEDGSRTESEMARVVGESMEDLEGNFQLDGEIRAIDIGGEYGDSLKAKWGYLDQSGTIYRICDVTVPLIFDTATATLAP